MMSRPHDWARTHAVLVAVEAYAGGTDWDLSGPANDAARMMRWLLERGVPGNRMHLLASPLAENEGLLAGFTEAHRSTAERGEVRRVFRDELRRIDVDWLWVYWAGHGIQSGGNRWSLLYPESRTGDPLGVDAENLVSLLRTTHLPARGPGRATVVIDACRSALSPREHAQAQPPETIAAHPETHRTRQIFLMRASRAGEAAKNRAGAGVFTSQLMDRLEAESRSDAAAVPDLEQVSAAVLADFRRLETVAGAGPVPTFYVRDWHGNESHYSHRPLLGRLTELQTADRDKLALCVQAALTARTAVTTRVAAELMGELGSGLPCAPDELEAGAIVDWSLTRPHGTVTLIHLLASCGVSKAETGAMRRNSLQLARGRWLLCSEQDELVRLLSSLPGDFAKAFADAARDEALGVVFTDTEPKALASHLEELPADERRLPRLLGAVERVAAVMSSDPLAEQLREWSQNCALRLGENMLAALGSRRAELAERAAHARPDTDDRIGTEDRVQIRLSRPVDPSGRRTCQIWTRTAAGAESVRTQDVPVPLADLQRIVDAVLTRHGRAHRTLVEFFVDAADLDLDVHRWRIGADGPVERSIGTDFPVVLRCTEYRRHDQEHLWQRRWKRAATAQVDDLHWLPANLTTVKAVHGSVSAREDAPGTVLTAAGAHRSAAVTACLFGGVPVMVWRGGAEHGDLETELRSFLDGGPLGALPARLRRLRAACDADEQHSGGRLALLWDDPECPLPRGLDLSAP
ncbi:MULTISPECIES: VMAP-C domain-containing protein [Streptomyces]|uniref:VMAP-C domain-containing protein n=1 Tax=Streptomyces TaxID=1883 RepID=UPI0003A19BD1|nr:MULTISPECIES: caspase family protein [Streptomyces]MBZ6109360.1 caspase family protein [Streptomyces olivaceus]MBZ6123713.1 caspase family protein [Streptomyces olivaceus]MBZ6143821.1 caspase family protein [Streptomyces olivaceus]MBZ6157661.1 caspase family protein [Streptomyces olivaceus]MBZ6185457.1 caspase family protein [Streptomyces olivaceus]